MITKKDNKWSVYSFILVVQALYSLKAWFFLGVPDMIGTLVFFAISVLYLLIAPFWDYHNSKRIVVAFMIVLFYLYKTFIDGGNLSFYLMQLMSSMTLVPLVLLKPKYQVDLLEKFQKVTYVLISISLFFWFFHLIGADLPYNDLYYGTVDRGNGLEDQYYFHNHYVYLVNQSWLLRSGSVVPDFLRFSSVFLEPGYLAILMTFLLYINNFDFKEKRNWVYLGAVIVSVSLAGFLMTIFAFVAHSIRNKKHVLPGLIMMLLVLFFGYDFFKGYNRGNNVINQGIIQRLEYDQTTGNIAGYNRTSSNVDDVFSTFITSPDVLSGIGSKSVASFSGSSVGYKVFIMQYGVIGLFFFLTYLTIISRMGRSYKSSVLLLLYVLMFIRGHVTMLYFSFMLVYICGVVQSKKESLKMQKTTKVSI